MDQLVEIPLNELKELQEKYQENWMENIFGYNTINTYLRWKSENNEMENFRIYSLNGNHRDGTFVSIHFNTIYGDTLNECCDNLIKALSLLDLSPQKQYRYIYAEVVKPAVMAFVRRKGLQIVNEAKLPTFFIGPKTGEQQIINDLPKGFIAKSLSEKDTIEIVPYWKYYFPTADRWLAFLIRNNPNIGIYTNNGQLVGWALRYEYGGLALLYVHEPFRKRGLATFINKAMAKMVGQIGENFCFVNNLACKLFQPIGYHSMGHVYFIDIMQLK